LHAKRERKPVYARTAMRLMVGQRCCRSRPPRVCLPALLNWLLPSMSKRPSHPSVPERPSAGNAAIERAVLALRMQRPNEAELLAAGVLKSDRGNSKAAQVLGRALMMQNRAAEAIVVLERASRRSNDPAIETLLAGALSAAGRRDDALNQLRKTTARRPAFPPAFLEQGGQLSRLGRLDEAVAVLESGLALAPEMADLHMELGYVQLKRNKRAEARAGFERVLTAAPERHDTLLALAKVIALDGEYAAAAELYRRALGVRPDDGVTRNNLGICLLEMGERGAAETNLRAAARGAPQAAGRSIASLASASRGRFFLRPSAAAKFLEIEKR
jgi:tetratricopeptide (TPR) repeat protein